jgi:NAD(P)-dependent dehydrogenase (short-subunit alcohol dehydrogenase family)
VHERVAVVTGAAGGIGRATAARLLEEGYCVVGIGRHRESLEDTARSFGANAKRFEVRAVDVRDAGELEDCFRALTRVHTVVANAGIGRGRPLLGRRKLRACGAANGVDGSVRVTTTIVTTRSRRRSGLADVLEHRDAVLSMEPRVPRGCLLSRALTVAAGKPIGGWRHGCHAAQCGSSSSVSREFSTCADSDWVRR